MDVDIRLLWWEGCPSYPAAWQRLQEVLIDMNLDAQPKSVEVKTDEEAERWHFPGSPTILVNGQDVDPNAATLPSRLTCRLYFKEDGEGTAKFYGCGTNLPVLILRMALSFQDATTTFL